MDKTYDNRAWLLVLPVFVIVAFSAIIPLMTVVNYAFQDILDPEHATWVGVDWFATRCWPTTTLAGALVRQLVFSLSCWRSRYPSAWRWRSPCRRAARWASACLVLVALPLLIPWNVVGTIWQIFARGDIGLLGWAVNRLGIDHNYTAHPTDAWPTIVVMDVWHWTPLVVLLCYAGLRAIPDAYYQAASIDAASRWDVFRYIQLPKMRSVLPIAILLRFMDSFTIYTEAFVLTGGGPGNATTFLSIHLAKIALGQFDLGPAAAMLVIYFLIVLPLASSSIA